MRYWVYDSAGRLRGGVEVASKRIVKRMEAKGFRLIPTGGK